MSSAGERFEKRTYSKTRNAHADFMNNLSNIDRATRAAMKEKATRMGNIHVKAMIGPGRTDRLVVGQHNASIARSTGAPRPVANVIGALARNPGRVGLGMAAAAAGAYMLSSSKARADDGMQSMALEKGSDRQSSTSLGNLGLGVMGAAGVVSGAMGIIGQSRNSLDRSSSVMARAGIRSLGAIGILGGAVLAGAGAYGQAKRLQDARTGATFERTRLDPRSGKMITETVRKRQQ